MEQNKIVTGVICLVAGVLLGAVIFGGKGDTAPAISNTNNTHHVMPDGSNMNNSMDMASMMAGMNAKLSGKTGDAFDQAFITEMIMHHEGAVEMAELALTNAKHAEIKTLANAIISAQNSEIVQMKTWLKNWYKVETQ